MPTVPGLQQILMSGERLLSISAGLVIVYRVPDILQADWCSVVVSRNPVGP